MTNVAIIGAGMAGFGAAFQCHNMGIPATVYEQHNYHGGHAASFSKDGFVFDDGPHVSFTKNERLQVLFARSMGNQFEIVKTNPNNYWKGYWIKHPAQCNLYGLPQNMVLEILVDFIQRNTNADIKNYQDWLMASFGKKFAETFPMQYTRKFHTTTANNMTTDWVGPRLYQPDLREVLLGALSPSTPDVHYVDHFRYPTHGGFVRILDCFLPTTRMMLNHQVSAIDPRNNILSFTNGSQINYQSLISTIALPDLIPLIQGVPNEVLRASQRLACSSCVLVNLGINRPDISASQWTYFYDDEFIFTRLSFPHLLSPFTTPEGAGSIQAEIYFSKKYKPLDRTPQDCISSTISDLKKCGLLQNEDNILYSDSRVVPYANIIYDLDRKPALDIVHGFLKKAGIGYAGRYGEWGYHWSDGSFISGENAAKQILPIIP